jgi:hypothetical protein
VCRRQHQEADELAVLLSLRCDGPAAAADGAEPNPVAQAFNLATENHMLSVRLGHLGAGAGTPVQEAKHFGIRVELGFQVEVAVGQRSRRPR